MKLKINSSNQVWLLLLTICALGFLLRWGVDLHNGWLARSMTKPSSFSSLPSDTAYRQTGGSVTCFQAEQTFFTSGYRWCSTKRDLAISSLSNPPAVAAYSKNEFQDLVRKGWKQYYSLPRSVNSASLPPIYQVDLQYRSTKTFFNNTAAIVCKADIATEDGKTFSQTRDCSWRAALSLTPQTLILHVVCITIIWLIWRNAYKRSRFSLARILLVALLVVYALLVARYMLVVNFLAMPPKADKNVSLQNSAKPQSETVADKVSSVWTSHSYYVLQGPDYELTQRKIVDTPSGCPCLRSTYISLNGNFQFDVEEHYGNSRYTEQSDSNPARITTVKGIATLYQISDAQRQDAYTANGVFTLWIMVPSGIDQVSVIKIINDLLPLPASTVQLL